MIIGDLSTFCFNPAFCPSSSKRRIEEICTYAHVPLDSRYLNKSSRKKCDDSFSEEFKICNFTNKLLL